MAYVAPNGKIQLFHGMSLTPDYNHTIWFDTQAHQDDMFSQIVYKEYNNQMYTRVSGNRCRIKDVADSIMDCNYMRFQNTRNNITKWFYAFITDIKYINENVTELTFQIDVIQSWYFQGQFKTCFIERQHAADDTWGKNIEPEPLIPREYVSCDTLSSVSSDNVSYIMTIGSYNFNSGSSPTLINQSTYSGYASTVKFIVFEDTGTPNDNDYMSAGDKIIQFLNKCNFVEGAISGLFMDSDMWDIISLTVVPSGFFKMYDATTGSEIVDTQLIGTGDERIKLKTISETVDEFTFTRVGSSNINMPRPTRHGTNDRPYYPKNNKMFTYPYTYLSVETPTESKEFKYELFPFTGDPLTPTGIVFKLRSMCNPTPGIIIYPVNYKNDTNPYQYCMTVGDFPQLPIYMNGITAQLGKLTAGAIKLIGGMLVGGAIGAVSASMIPSVPQASAAEMVASGASSKEIVSSMMKPSTSDVIMGDVEQGINFARKQIPTISAHSQLNNGAGCTDLGLVMGRYGDNTAVTFRVSIHQYGLLKQTAEKFDQFMSKYGYAQNAVAVPNVHAREKWTYIKTRDCNFVGYVPSEASRKINEIMDSGITWWDWRTNIGNYGDFTNPVVAVG